MAGECLVLDNKRVLHGREVETDLIRRLQGCYLGTGWVGGTVFSPYRYLKYQNPVLHGLRVTLD